MAARCDAPGAWPAWCLGNHDHSRVASRYGARAVRVAAMLVVTLRGTPFFFQGEELGLADVPVPPDRIVDVDGRDPERGPQPATAVATELHVEPAAVAQGLAAQRQDVL